MKTWVHSKILWLNIIAVVIQVVTMIINSDLALNATWMSILGGVVTIGNIILRLLSTGTQIVSQKNQDKLNSDK